MLETITTVLGAEVYAQGDGLQPVNLVIRRR